LCVTSAVGLYRFGFSWKAGSLRWSVEVLEISRGVVFFFFSCF